MTSATVPARSRPVLNSAGAPADTIGSGAGERHRSQRRRRLGEQLLERRTPTDLRPSPSGDVLAFTVEKMDESGTASSVWVTEAGGSPRRLAAWDQISSVSVPRWSPDGHWLLVAVHGTNSSLQAQIAVATAPFERVEPLAVLPGHPEDVLFSADSQRILALCASPGADSVVTAGAVRYAPPTRRNRPVVTRPGIGQRRVYGMAMSGSRLRNLGPSTGSVWDAAWCADGAVAVVWSGDPSESGWYDSVLGILDPETGAVREIYRPAWQLSPLAAAPSGSRVAVVEGWSSDRGRVCGDIRVVDMATGEVDELAWIGVDVVTVAWRTDTTLWFSGWRGMAAVWGWVGVDGTVGLLREDDIAPSSLAAPTRSAAPGSEHSPADRVWAAGLSSTDSGAEVAVCAPAGAQAPWSTLTRLTRRPLDDFADVVTHPLSWPGADGLRIDGLLVTGTGASAPAPLVVYAHGGPAGLWTRVVPIEVRFLVDAGFAVLLANPRGSVGRGQVFARANLGDAGGAELTDMLAGIAACATVVGVDTTRVGVVGGSYGGYLAACAATGSDQICCAVMMSGHPDLLSARYGSNNPAFYDKLMLGAPGSGAAAEFVARSPVIHATETTAPMLLLHGAEDRCSPLGQAEEMYRALIDCRVDTELVVYPGEGHGLHSVVARSDSWSRTAGWLDRYLGSDRP